MCCGERLHTLKGIDTEVGEIFKKADDTSVLVTNRCFKPPTLLRQSCLLESQIQCFRLRTVYGSVVANNFDSITLKSMSNHLCNSHLTYKYF